MDGDQRIKPARRAISAMFLANGFVMGAWAPQIPLLLPRHDISETTLGLLILALGIGAVGAMLFSGRLIAVYGSRRVVSGFSLALIPALPAVVFAPSIPALALGMAVFGAMVGCMDVAMNAQAVEIEKRMQRAIMSASHGFWSLGGFVGGFAGSYVTALWGAEVQALITAGITAALVFGAMPFLLPSPPVPSPPVPSPPVPSPAGPQAGVAAARPHLLPRDLALWILGAMALASMIPEGAVLDWAAIYLAKELGSDVFRSGLAFAFFAAAMALMRFAGDGVRNRFGAVRTLRLSGVLGAAGLMGGAMAPSDWVAIASFAIAGLGVANMVPIMFSAAGNHPGLPPAVAISTVTMVGYSGILIAPASIGFLAEHLGYRPTYGGLSLLLLGVALMAGRVAQADRLQAAAPGAQAPGTATAVN